MARRCIIAFLFGLTIPLCLANEVEPPPLTEKGLVGRWEGATLGFDYWYRMDIFPSGGYLAVVQRGDRALYKLEYSKIIGRNDLELRFRNISEKGPLPIMIRMSATGYAFGEDPGGELHATVTTESGNVHQEDRVDFEKGADPSEDLIKMLKDADKMIDDAKRKHL